LAESRRDRDASGAVDRHAGKVIDFELGSRSVKTLKPLWERLSLKSTVTVCSDYFPAYSAVIPAQQHVESKAETWSVEGKNSQIRHRLARFHRKTFCYSKCRQVVEASLKLLFKYTNI